MANFEIRPYRTSDEQSLIDLWREAGLLVPWNNPRADIQRKLDDSAELFFVGLLAGKLIGSCMAGYDGHRGWIYFLAIKTAHRSRGFAARLVSHAETELLARGCPKIDLMVRETNHNVIAFYRSNGYRIDPVVVLSKRLIDEDNPDLP